MAILRIFQCIDNDVWKLTFVNDPDQLSDTDKKLMNKFGEPEIQVGGDYTWEEGHTYTLPTKTVRIRSDFPFTQTFDGNSTDFSSDTQAKVEYYRDQIVSSFTAALTTLREHSDTFTGEHTYTI